MGVCIFSTVNQIEADLLKGALEEKQIDCFLQNYHSNTVGIGGWTVPFAGTNLVTGNIEIFVKDEDVENAFDIVQSLFGGTNENVNNSGAEKIKFSSDHSENKEIKGLENSFKEFKNGIDNKDNRENNKISPRKKFLIFISIVFFVMILFTAYISISPDKRMVKNSQTSMQEEKIMVQKYYYEVFLIDKLHYLMISQPPSWDFNTIKDYRNLLKKSPEYRLLYSTADASDNDILTVFTNSGYTPSESTALISEINNVGSKMFWGEYQESPNYMHITYFEKLENTEIHNSDALGTVQSNNIPSDPTMIIGEWEDSILEGRTCHIFLSSGKYIYGYKSSNAALSGKWILDKNIISIDDVDEFSNDDYVREKPFQMILKIIDRDNIILVTDRYSPNERILTRIK